VKTVRGSMTDRQVLEIDADLRNLSAIRRFLENSAARLGIGADMTADMVQAVDEAATNIVIHAYRRGPGRIEVEVQRDREWMIVRLRDRGPAFDPTHVPDPDLSLPLEERRIGGLGIHLMRHFSDSMSWKRTRDNENELTLAKRVTVSNGSSGL
jgi:serine/threonine-protein kinase RsbW